MNGRPKYYDKHPCVACGTGYGECAQGLSTSLKCCRNCAHPTRWEPNPWDAEDLAEFEAINAARHASHQLPSGNWRVAIKHGGRRRHHPDCVDHAHHHDEPCLGADGQFHVLDKYVTAVLSRPDDPR